MQSSEPSFPSPRNGWDDLLFWLTAFVVLTVLVLSLGCGGTRVSLFDRTNPIHDRDWGDPLCDPAGIPASLRRPDIETDDPS